jgi:hypothetical protein
MLDMRFASVVRYFGYRPLPSYPANSDDAPRREAATGSMPPFMPVAGVNWTRHTRPRPSAPRPGRRAHLRVVK